MRRNRTTQSHDAIARKARERFWVPMATSRGMIALTDFPSALSSLDWPGLLRSVGFALLGGLGMYFVVGGIFELAYYRRREAALDWKCQPRRWPSPKARRDEIILGSANMAAASTASG